jgi:outer membrane protein assembly factor BamD (BamD/ComL family)
MSMTNSERLQVAQQAISTKDYAKAIKLLEEVKQNTEMGSPESIKAQMALVKAYYHSNA